MTAPTVLVCEDALGFRMLLCRLVEEAGAQVAAEAGTWQEAERLAAETEPAAVIVDLWMPEVDTAALGRIRARLPGARIVALSGLSAEEARDVVGEAGSVDRYLSKRQPPDELVVALREVLAAPPACA